LKEVVEMVDLEEATEQDSSERSEADVKFMLWTIAGSFVVIAGCILLGGA